MKKTLNVDDRKSTRACSGASSPSFFFELRVLGKRFVTDFLLGYYGIFHFGWDDGISTSN